MSDTTSLADDAGNDKYTVPALERGLRLLGEFNRDTRVISAPEFARRRGTPRRRANSGALITRVSRLNSPSSRRPRSSAGTVYLSLPASSARLVVSDMVVPECGGQ